MDEWEFTPVPNDVTDEQAALTEPCAVTVHAVRLSDVKLGDAVVVLGAGPIGLLCMQTARAAGATTVIVSEPATACAEAARRLGADTVINPLQDDLEARVMELTGGAGPQVVFETGFLKKGDKSVGVQRQYSGTAGRIENCQVGVFLAYASDKGRTLLDRELYLPQVWAEDWERRREAGVPEDVGFQTKPRLAQRMLERALESGVPFRWVAGDEVYGNDRNLRLWLEHQGIPHVLAIKRSEKLWALTEKGSRQVRADRLASQVDETGWVRCSTGDGAKGPRIYDWTAVALRPVREPGKGHWLLVRRSVAKPEELAYYVCYGPAGTALEELARVAGTRWAIEECFEEAKGQVGLDQYEVRRWDGWYRHITLAMLAQAYLAVIRHQAMQQGEKGAATVRMKR